MGRGTAWMLVSMIRCLRQKCKSTEYLDAVRQKTSAPESQTQNGWIGGFLRWRMKDLRWHRRQPAIYSEKPDSNRDVAAQAAIQAVSSSSKPGAPVGLAPDAEGENV